MNKLILLLPLIITTGLFTAPGGQKRLRSGSKEGNCKTAFRRRRIARPMPKRFAVISDELELDRDLVNDGLMFIAGVKREKNRFLGTFMLAKLYSTNTYAKISFDRLNEKINEERDSILREIAQRKKRNGESRSDGYYYVGQIPKCGIETFFGELEKEEIKGNAMAKRILKAIEREAMTILVEAVTTLLK